MKGAELQERRVRAGLSVEEVAAAVGVGPAEVIGWEQGGRISKDDAAFLPFFLYGAEAKRLLDASGLAVCAWAAARPEPPDVASPGFEAFAEADLAHARTCEVCRAREAFVTRRLGLPPTSAGILLSAWTHLSRLPEPLRTAVGGSALALLLNGVAIGVGLAAGATGGRGMWWGALGLLVLSVGAGGAAGLVFFATRRIRRAGWLGYYASYVAATTIYLSALFRGLAWMSTQARFRDALAGAADTIQGPSTWVVVVAMGAVFGVVAGASARSSATAATAGTARWRKWAYGVAVMCGIVLAVERGGAGRTTRVTESDAIAPLRAAVAAHPADVGARLALGQALALRADLDGAAAEYRAALRIDAQVGAAYTGLAAVAFYRGRYREALAAADSARGLGDTTTSLPQVRADALRRLGRCREAIVELGPFVASHPDWLPARLSLSRCYRALGRNAEALEVIREAVRLEPASPPLRGELFEALAAVGRLDSARAEARWQVEHWPRDAFSWVAFGKIGFLTNRMDEAREGFARAFALRPGLRDSLAPLEREIVRAMRQADPLAP
jgi:tetratricopeptide (TPR) repeat protein